MERLAGRGSANGERLEIHPAEIAGKIGWGGRIRTFTIHINSVVSYRLDHAPAVLAADYRSSKLSRLRRTGRSEGFF